MIGFMTFLAVLSGGIVLSISNAIRRFSAGLEKSGIIIVMPDASMEAANKIVRDNSANIKSARATGRQDAAKLLKNWLPSTEALHSYIPQIIEIEAASKSALTKIERETAAAKLRFAGAAAASGDRKIGLRIIGLAGFILMVVLGALLICIIHSVRNIILIHAREIEILKQVGAAPKYIAGQIGRTMLGLSVCGVLAGLASGAAMLAAAVGLSRAAKVGLLANMGFGRDWMALPFMGLGLVIMIMIATRRTAGKLLYK
jgi:cell division protein FtsX